MQSNKARDILTAFAAKAEKAPAPKVQDFARDAVKELVKSGIQEGHLEGLFGLLEPYGLNQKNGKKWRDAITEAF
jgi:hypothetical protein